MSFNDDWISFCDSNSSPVVSGSLNDKWIGFLTQQNGSFTTFQDSTIIYLKANGATGDTYNDLWRSFLVIKGYTTGNLNDDMDSFFKGASPSSLTDSFISEDGLYYFTSEDGLNYFQQE